MGEAFQGSVSFRETGGPASGMRVRLLDRAFYRALELAGVETDDDGSYSLASSTAVEQATLLQLVVEDRFAIVRAAIALDERHALAPIAIAGTRDAPPPRVVVGGVAVDRAAYVRLTQSELVSVAASLRRSPGDVEAMALLEELHPLLADALRYPAFSLTPLIRFVRAAARDRDWDVDAVDEALQMRRAPRAPGRAGPRGPVSRADRRECPPFTVVDARAAGSSPESLRVAHYMERACYWLQRAHAVYRSPAFALRALSAPVVVTLETAQGPLGAGGNGHIRVRDGLDDEVLGWVLAHELVHVFQDEYAPAPGVASDAWTSGILEGGAVLGEDAVLDSINRWIAEAASFGIAPGTLAAPERPLIELSQRYKVSLLLKYVAEQQSPRVTPADEPLIGVETYRRLLEECAAQGYTTEAFEAAVEALPWNQRLLRFTWAGLDRTASETLLGNFRLACALKDLGNPLGDRRFDFLEDEEEERATALYPGSQPAAIRRLASLHPLEIWSSSAYQAIHALGPHSARYHRIRPSAGADTVRIAFAVGKYEFPLLQIVPIDAKGAEVRVRDILRCDRSSFGGAIPLSGPEAGWTLDHVLVVVASTWVPFDYTLSASEVGPEHDVTITPWNCAAGTHYEVDSRNGAWTWRSPDLWVGSRAGAKPPQRGATQDLWVRLRNQGNAAASAVSVELDYQEATDEIDPAAWQPIGRVDGLALAARSELRAPVTWTLPAGDPSAALRVRAVVSVGGASPTERQRALTTLGAATPYAGGVDLVLPRRSAEPRSTTSPPVPAPPDDGPATSVDEVVRPPSRPHRARVRPGPEPTDDDPRATRDARASQLPPGATRSDS